MKIILSIAAVVICTATLLYAETGNSPGDKEGKKLYLYEWTDAKGDIHISDNLDRVPEQYRSGARIIDTKKGQEPGPGQTYQQSGSGANAEQDGLKLQWQQRIKGWKDRLADAEKQYQNAERERRELLHGYGSDIYASPENKIKARHLAEQMKEFQQEIETAKDMIENRIPEEARKAGVPPGWLRE